MVTVKLKTGLAGLRFALAPGDEYECEAAEAARLVDAGFAKHLGKPPTRPVETDGEEPDDVPLDKRKVAELAEMAKAAGHEITGKEKKADLIALLSD